MLFCIVADFFLGIDVLQAKRKRARTPTPGEYLGVRGIYLNLLLCFCLWSGALLLFVQYSWYKNDTGTGIMVVIVYLLFIFNRKVIH